jgi:L-aspartate oxidase
MNKNQFDFIIIGCGLAGLYSALNASKYGTVALITKTTLELSNSYWAQGGIAAAIDEEDSPGLHLEDTLKAGRGLCNYNAVEILVNEGKQRISELIELGMPFDKEDEKIALGLEGGHSKRRVLHSGGDATGREIVNFLMRLAINEKQIKIFENTLIYKLNVGNGECYGVCAYDFSKNNNFILYGRSTIIASGGGSAIYSRSTNPHTSIGDGIILAYEAGAAIESMEFIQFHPTSFFSKSGETFLISEAVRGEGAYLVNFKGERFLNESNLTELAPRDVVSEAIFNEMNKSGKPNVFLKLDHLDSNKIKARFSNIFLEAKKFGIDITRDPVPVAPAAHYMVGGIKTGINAETNIKRLFAVGEAASSGIHGANRLASNSLLECLVFSKRAVEFSQQNFDKTDFVNFKNEFFINYDLQKQFSEVQNRTAQLMWNNVGISRSKEKLLCILKELDKLKTENENNDCEYFSQRKNNLILLAQLITSAALFREESRGCHTRSDFPSENHYFCGTIVQKINNATKLFKNL